jgi:hypothetical protein
MIDYESNFVKIYLTNDRKSTNLTLPIARSHIVTRHVIACRGCCTGVDAMWDE